MRKKERSESQSSQSSGESRESSRSRSLSPQNKIFVSHLDSKEENAILCKNIRELFQTKCTVESVDVKRSSNNEYCYAFVEIKENNKLAEIIQAFNGVQLGITKIRVEKQLSVPKGRRNRREPSPRRNRTCYNCNKEGHIARLCPRKEGRSSAGRQSREKGRDNKRERERENSQSKKRKRHRRSSSSEEDSSSSSSRRDRKGKKKNIRRKSKKEDRRKKKARRHHSSSSS